MSHPRRGCQSARLQVRQLSSADQIQPKPKLHDLCIVHVDVNVNVQRKALDQEREEKSKEIEEEGKVR